jgi:signal transduction histidine kinase
VNRPPAVGAPSPAGATSNATARTLPADRPTLLVVDDEPEVLRSIFDLFRLDYRVITCGGGAEAIAVLDAADDLHVVMTDQRMPGVTGVEVLRHARAVRPEATRLLITAYSDVKAVVDAINQGSVFRHVTKPWDPDELQAIVKQAVERHDLIVERDRLMTELRETNKRLLEADRLKGAFIEVASHELNTPVAVVLGMTQLWKMTQADHATPAERNWVDRIHSAGKRLAATVERMLKLVRADDLSRPLDARPTALEPLARAAAAELEPFLKARGQTVTVDAAPDLGSADVDAAKVADVLTNLLINAIKFTPDGGSIRLFAAADGDDHVRFEVTDQGPGVEPLASQYMFEPFFTGFDTMHHSSGEFEYGKRGMGLGLCLVKKFVEMHGGSVAVRSEPGGGSTFAFRLPRASRPVNGKGGSSGS